MDTDKHLDPAQIASYLDHLVNPVDRVVVESHCATCPECRAELREVHRVIRTAPVRLPRYTAVMLPLAAAALLAITLIPTGPEPIPAHREGAAAIPPGPMPMAPAGESGRPSRLAWSSVRDAEVYEAILFDSTGAVLWSVTQADTVVALPDSIVLRRGHRYYWMVRARTGWDRWVSSALTGFRISEVAASP